MSEYIKKTRVLVEELLSDKSIEFSLIEAKDGLRNTIESSDINRPGLSLAGWFKHFTRHRIQIFGLTEMEYLKSLPPERMNEILDIFFEHENTALILSRNLEPPAYFIQKCRETKTPLLSTSLKASELIRLLIPILELKLNPRIIIHGELVEVFGVGIMITGRSGIGKSECALELVKKNHILIADDITEIYRTRNNDLIGCGSEIIKYHLEIRGIGIINIKTLFGVGAVKDNVKLDMVIEVEDWNNSKEYDRLGLVESTTEILGVSLNKLCIPMRIGRNLASIVEVAAMNYRSKKMGFYSVKEFNKRLINWLQGKEE